MASRMERYTKEESKTSARSDRNKSLYKQIEDLDSYTNIAGVAAIKDKNPIDIEKVKELLNKRELKTQERIIEKKEESEKKEPEIVKHYDVKDLLSIAKENSQNAGEKYKNLSEKQKNFLKSLNERKKELQKEEEELDELVKTISNIKVKNESNIEDTDDIGLFDDLKSDTMVGDASSIKKIIEQEKELTEEFDEMKLDKSFYTSSFGFTKKDFEELKNINTKVKKDNNKLITLLIVLVTIVIFIITFLIITL